MTSTVVLFMTRMVELVMTGTVVLAMTRMDRHTNYLPPNNERSERGKEGEGSLSIK